MKKHLLVFATLFLGITNCIFSQNTDLSKYAGKYYLIQQKADSVIKYDYITFYVDNNKLYCNRDFFFTSSSVEAAKNNKPHHQNYEVVSVDVKSETIVLKYMSSKCSYKFMKNN
jgi:hypothetical protein